MSQPAGDASKHEWRRWARAERDSLDFTELSGEVVRRLASWPLLTRARTVLLFLPLPDEVDLRPLITMRPSTRFVATRTPEAGGVLTVHEIGESLERHRLGFEQPPASAPAVEPSELDVLLLPGLAFDLWGVRLGRGAGYFDRLLMEIDATVPVVGVTPAKLVVDRLPKEPHDLPVGFLATDEGVVEVAGAPPAVMP